MHYKECKYLALKNKRNRHDMNTFLINLINLAENIATANFNVNKTLVISAFNVNHSEEIWNSRQVQIVIDKTTEYNF